MFDEEIDDSKTERLIAAKRHKELKELFVQLSNSIKENQNKGIAEAVDRQSEIIKDFIRVTSLQITREIKAPNVNVEVNINEVVLSISQMSKDILNGIEQLKNEIAILNRPKEWEFKVTRDSYTQYINSVTAKMSFIKPKHQA